MRSFPSSCAVRKILVSVTIGEDLPGGRLVSQITLEPGPKTAGSGPSSATPVPFGPRNRVQSDAIATQVKTSRDRSVLTNGMAKDYPISTRQWPGRRGDFQSPIPRLPNSPPEFGGWKPPLRLGGWNRCSNPWRTPTGRQRIDSVIAVYGRTCIPAGLHSSPVTYGLECSLGAFGPASRVPVTGGRSPRKDSEAGLPKPKAQRSAEDP